MSKDDSDNIYIKDFRQLKVWQKSVELTDKIYDVVAGFPDYERFNLCDQLRKCSSSVGANISEGNSKIFSRKELNYASQALGSAG